MKIRFLKLERHTNGRWPLTEEDLKILKVKYIDFLKVSNVEYLSKHCSDLSFRLLLRGPNWKLLFIKFTKLRNRRQWLKGRWPQSIKGGIYQQPLIGSSPNQENNTLNPDSCFIGGNSEEIIAEISSVALLSPVCLIIQSIILGPQNGFHLILFLFIKNHIIVEHNFREQTDHSPIAYYIKS